MAATSRFKPLARWRWFSCCSERKKVLALAQARKVDVILVTELTRWGRSARFAARSLTCFKFRFVSSPPIVRQRIEVGGPLLVLVRKPHLIPPDEGRIEASEVEETGIELNENVSGNYLLVRLALDALGCPRENESPGRQRP